MPVHVGVIAMPDPLRICLFDADLSTEEPFRGPFETLNNVLIMGETSTWDELREWLRHGKLDMVAVNLGEREQQGLAIVERIVDMSPGCGVLGVSRRTDPQTIITAMRAGCSQFVPWPVDHQDLVAAVERIRATRSTEVRTSKRICVIGSSGGAGTTTVACNLAMELAHVTNRRCGLVDLNLEFGDVGSSFDCNPAYTIADVCRQEVEADRLLLGKALHELPCNVSILARPNKLAEALEVQPERLESTLQVMATMFPFVVIDLPRSANPVSTIAVRTADRVLVVTQLGVPFIRNATRIYDSLLQMGAAEGSVEIVLNRCNANFERIAPEEVEAHFGQPIFAMIPNDYRRVQTSLDFGHPIVADAPSSPARLAIQQMARNLASDQVTDDQTPPPTAGFFSRFWQRPAKVGRGG